MTLVNVTYQSHVLCHSAVVCGRQCDGCQHRHPPALSSVSPSPFVGSHDFHALYSSFLPPISSPYSYLFTLSSFFLSVCGMGIQFGSFNGICQTAALVICPLIGSDQGIEPSCYSRNVDIAGTLIFQPCECCPPFARGVKAIQSPRFRKLIFSPSNPLFPCPTINSNMLRPYRRNTDDWNNDLSHTK